MTRVSVTNHPKPLSRIEALHRLHEAWAIFVAQMCDSYAHLMPSLEASARTARASAKRHAAAAEEARKLLDSG